jgi:hypothetical protein
MANDHILTSKIAGAMIAKAVNNIKSGTITLNTSVDNAKAISPYQAGLLITKGFNKLYTDSYNYPQGIFETNVNANKIHAMTVSGMTILINAAKTKYTNTPPIFYINPSITTTTLPNGKVNVAYSATVTGTNGETPYTWSATGLPNGLAINTSTGVISGTPTVAGDRTITITLTDKLNTQVQKQLSMTIANPALVINTTSLPAATKGTAYSYTVSGSGGSGTGYSWSATGLPAGLNISAAGVISGTPTGATSNVTLTLKDSTNTTVTKTLSLTVEPTEDAAGYPYPSGTLVDTLICSLGGSAVSSCSDQTADLTGLYGIYSTHENDSVWYVIRLNNQNIYISGTSSMGSLFRMCWVRTGSTYNTSLNGIGSRIYIYKIKD